MPVYLILFGLFLIYLLKIFFYVRQRNAFKSEREAGEFRRVYKLSGKKKTSQFAIESRQ